MDAATYNSSDYIIILLFFGTPYQWVVGHQVQTLDTKLCATFFRCLPVLGPTSAKVQNQSRQSTTRFVLTIAHGTPIGKAEPSLCGPPILLSERDVTRNPPTTVARRRHTPTAATRPPSALPSQNSTLASHCTFVRGFVCGGSDSGARFRGGPSALPQPLLPITATRERALAQKRVVFVRPSRTRRDHRRR